MGNRHFSSAIRPYRCENSFPHCRGADTTTPHHLRSPPIRSATAALRRGHILPPHTPLRAFSNRDHDEAGPAPYRAASGLEAPAPANKEHFDQRSQRVAGFNAELNSDQENHSSESARTPSAGPSFCKASANAVGRTQLNEATSILPTPAEGPSNRHTAARSTPTNPSLVPETWQPAPRARARRAGAGRRAGPTH